MSTLLMESDTVLLSLYPIDIMALPYSLPGKISLPCKNKESFFLIKLVFVRGCSVIGSLKLYKIKL